MGDKYAPLHERLADLAKRGATAAAFSFADLDALVGGLPPSARAHRAWWSNGSQPHAESSWLAAGWLLESVSFERETAEFRRGEEDLVSSSDSANVPTQSSAKPAFDLETRPEAGNTDVRVIIRWREAGQISVEDSKLVFPVLPKEPGLYRMTMTGARQDKPRLYIGETEDLKKRSYGYCNPQPTQSTNRRLNDRLLSHLGDGGSACLAVALEVQVAHGQAALTALDLSNKASRLLAENAALVSTKMAGGDVEIENCD